MNTLSGVSGILVVILSGILIVGAFLVWLRMLLDSIKQKRGLWLILIIVFGIWAAILYGFLVYNKPSRKRSN